MKWGDSDKQGELFATEIRRRQADIKDREEVELGDIWEFLHTINNKLDVHLALYNAQQPRLKALLSAFEKYTIMKWVVLFTASTIATIAVAWEHVVEGLRKILH